jgi:hypothetical protein
VTLRGVYSVTLYMRVSECLLSCPRFYYRDLSYEQDGPTLCQRRLTPQVKELTVLCISATSVSESRSRKEKKTGLAGLADVIGEDIVNNEQNYVDSNTISWDGNSDPENPKN